MQYLYAIMLIGYARVSTGEQTTAAQVAALKTSGCELIFRDNASGGRWDRPELHKLLSQLRKGDVLVVWTLDRLSRSLRDVLTIMERVQERHAGFRSLKEAVDTTTPAGRMMMQMVGAFAEFERAMLKERTKAGLDAARKEGRIGGRPPKLKPHQQQEIVTLVKQGKKTAADAARLFGVHPATVSRLLRRTWIESSTVLSVPLLPKPQAPRWFNRQLLCSQAPAEPIPLDDVTLFAGERSEQDGGPLVIEAATAEAADGWWAFRNDDGRTLKTLPTAAVRGIETVQSRRPWPGRINAHRPSGLVPAASGLHRVA